MPFCINEKEYNKLLGLLKKELNEVEDKILKITSGKSKSNTLPNLQNLQFELQILIHTLIEFPQFDENEKVVIVNMTDINKDRLIGFLLTKIKYAEV